MLVRDIFHIKWTTHDRQLRLHVCIDSRRDLPQWLFHGEAVVRHGTPMTVPAAAVLCASVLTRPLYYCLFAPHIFVCCSLRTSRSWWIALSTQRQLRGCNNILSFCNELCQSHVLLVKVAPGATSHLVKAHVAIGKPEWQVPKASHCDSKQQ